MTRLEQADQSHARALGRWKRAKERVDNQVRDIANAAMNAEWIRLRYRASRKDPAERARLGAELDAYLAQLDRDRAILDARVESMIQHAMAYERCSSRLHTALDAERA